MTELLHLLESILAVNLLVLVHEAGHLLSARLFRVPSLKFSIGLGPRLFGIGHGGTDYCISLVPIGGFVQLAQGHRHGNQSSCMDCIPAWKRMLIYLAGPAANLFCVVVLLWLAYCVIGYRDDQPVISAVEPNTPAAAAGLEPGDRILQVDGKRILAWSQVVLACRTGDRASANLVVQRPAGPGIPDFGGSETTVVLTFPTKDQGPLGMQPASEKILLRLGPVRALEVSLNKLWVLSGLLWDSVVGLTTAKIPPADLIGPVYLFHLSSEAASEGTASLVYLLAFISASLFFFNLLPMPVLDGGQILLAFLQRLLKRPLGDRSLRLLTPASIFWLLLLLASATLNDLVRLMAS